MPLRTSPRIEENDDITGVDGAVACEVGRAFAGEPVTVRGAYLDGVWPVARLGRLTEARQPRRAGGDDEVLEAVGGPVLRTIAEHSAL